MNEMVHFRSGDLELPAYLARPDGDGPFPGVVVIHEIFGLNDNIKDIAQRLAGEGYAALAVDLFAGRNRVACMFRFFTGMFLDSLDNSSIRDLKTALGYLAGQPWVDANRLGAIGFCMGGGFAIAWACTDSRLKVIAPFYGLNPRPLDAIARACPVAGSYPGKDFTTPQARKLAAELRRHRVPHDIKIYRGTSHAFFNDRIPAYNAEAAEDAWQRTLQYFGEKIGA